MFYQRKISRSCQHCLHHEQWYCNDDSLKVIDDNIIILHFPFSICIFFPSKRCWIECCRDFQIEQLQMAAVGYFACGNSSISTFHMNSQIFGMFEVFFSQAFRRFCFFLTFWKSEATFFRKPYHILRNLQKLSEFPPNDFFRVLCVCEEALWTNIMTYLTPSCLSKWTKDSGSLLMPFYPGGHSRTFIVK